MTTRTTPPKMTTWLVTHGGCPTATGEAQTMMTEVAAAYYTPEGELVEFKDSTHRVVFAVRSSAVLTVQRADADTSTEAAA